MLLPFFTFLLFAIVGTAQVMQLGGIGRRKRALTHFGMVMSCSLAIVANAMWESGTGRAKEWNHVVMVRGTLTVLTPYITPAALAASKTYLWLPPTQKCESEA